MGLFTKNPTQTNSSAPLYTIGNQKTLLIVGLGNVGDQYNGTRHNVGFFCIDAFVSAHPEFGTWVTKKDLKCTLTSGQFGDTRVVVIKPTTFMNNSGQSVQATQNFYKLTPSQTTVVYDELDIPFGTIRTRSGGGSAGHNGIKSIIEHTEDGFGRVRIGILNDHAPSTNTSDFVLKSFNAQEKKHLKALSNEVDSVLIESIFSGELAPITRSFIE